jgi:hypothetical protein
MAIAELGEFAGWAGLVIAVIGVLPKLVSTITRGKVGRFETILKAQDNLLDDCREECEKVTKDLQHERTERIREREHFYQQLTRVNNHIYECEGILRRNNWKDPRRVKRSTEGET